MKLYCQSRKQKRKTKRTEPCDWLVLRFRFRLGQCSFSLDHKPATEASKESDGKQNVLILPSSAKSMSWLTNMNFPQGRRRSYDCGFLSDPASILQEENGESEYYTAFCELSYDLVTVLKTMLLVSIVL